MQFAAAAKTGPFRIFITVAPDSEPPGDQLGEARCAERWVFPPCLVSPLHLRGPVSGAGFDLGDKHGRPTRTVVHVGRHHRVQLPFSGQGTGWR